jgi:hypothetical protein
MFLGGMYIWRVTSGAGAVVAIDCPRQIDCVVSEREVFLLLKKDLIGLRKIKTRRAQMSREIATKVSVWLLPVFLSEGTRNLPPTPTATLIVVLSGVLERKGERSSATAVAVGATLEDAVLAFPFPC